MKNKLTIDDLLKKVVKTEYTTLNDGRTTICQITLQNGYTLIGTSACISVETYNQALGEKYAFDHAIEKLWELEGYLRKEDISRKEEEAKGLLNNEFPEFNQAVFVNLFVPNDAIRGFNPADSVRVTVHGDGNLAGAEYFEGYTRYQIIRGVLCQA